MQHTLSIIMKSEISRSVISPSNSINIRVFVVILCVKVLKNSFNSQLLGTSAVLKRVASMQMSGCYNREHDLKMLSVELHVYTSNLNNIKEVCVCLEMSHSRTFTLDKYPVLFQSWWCYTFSNQGVFTNWTKILRISFLLWIILCLSSLYSCI